MIARLLYQEWRILALALGLILATGLLALDTIGRQEDPTITNINATIVTPFPGADPARVEAQVTEKIEQELREIAEIDEIVSASRAEISVIRVKLSLHLSASEVERTWSEIRDALADAALSFPEGVPEPSFDDQRTGAFTAIGAVMPAEGVAPNPALLRRYAEMLRDRLRQVPRTRFVRLFGAQEEEIVVEVEPRLLASLRLTAADVAGAIARADVKVSAGQVRRDDADMLIEVAGQIEGLERVRAVPLVTGRDGDVVRVGDVATVRRTVRDPVASLAFADGVPAVLVAARMEDDRQVDRWIASARAAMAEFERELPDGLEHRLLFDQSAYTAKRFAGLGFSLVLGVAIVVAVLFLTLGWRAALVVGCALPLTSLVSIAILEALGVPIHQMSVTGLIVALGLLVDATIVVTDDIGRRLSEGQPRRAAAGDAARRLAVPLLASTVTTVLTFTPMVLLPGPVGDFVGTIATTVIVMLGASLVLALTVTPALAGRILPDRHTATDRGWWTHGMSAGALGRIFAASLDLALAHRRLAVLGALVLPVLGFAAFPTLEPQFFPGADRDQLHVQLELQGRASLEATRRAALEAGRIIAADPDVESVHWVVGESAPSFYYNMLMNRDGVASFAEALVTTTSIDATPAVIPRLQAALDRALPGARVNVRGLKQGPPVEAPVEVRIVGPDTGTLRALGEAAQARLARIASITHTKASLSGGDPKVVFDIDEVRVHQAGLDLGAVATQLQAALEGAVGGSLVERTEELPVRVRVGPGVRSRVDAIRSTYVVTPAGQGRAAPAVPLTALGSLRLEPSESPILKRNGERTNTIRGFVAPGVLPQEALGAFQASLAEQPLSLPPGYRLEYGGDSAERAETVANLMAPVGLITALMVATIVLTFNSFRLSLIAAAVTVLSIGLSLLSLAISGYPIGMSALIGVIGSVGVSINAAIIILTTLQQDPDALAGDRRRTREIVVGSSRHIVSTTVTTFGGFLPLILAGGGFWPPFAIAIAGGVLLSTVISFYFTPPMFALLMAGKRGEADTRPTAEVVRLQPPEWRAEAA